MTADRLAALLHEAYPHKGTIGVLCFCPEIAARLAAAGVTVAAQPAGLDVERVAAFLHDEYGCRVTCRGGRLADDRHPSHNEAYRGQAERLIVATGRVTGDALVLDGPCDDQCRHD